MRKKILSFVVLTILFWGQDIYCQKIFRDGYIVKKTGESIIGMVEYSPNQDIPSACNFKRFDIARPVLYSSSDISAFGYKNGNRYEAKEVDNKSSFYEVVIRGRISLYSKKGKFYLEKDKLGLVEIKNGSVTYPASGDKKVYPSLSEFLTSVTEGKAGTIPSKLNIKNDITGLITLYNKESGNPYNVFNRTISQKQIAQEAVRSGANRNRVGVISGINVYMLSIRPLSNIYFPDPQKEAGLVYGLTYERIVSRKTDRLSLRLDLLYIRQTFYCYNERPSSGGTYIIRNDAFFNFTGIKAPLMLQYAITGGRIVPFFNGGLAYRFDLNNDYYRIEEVESPQHAINSLEYRDIAFRTGEFSVTTGAGVRTSIFNNMNIHFQGNLELGPGLFKTAYGTVRDFKTSSLQATFLLGLTF